MNQNTIAIANTEVTPAEWLPSGWIFVTRADSEKYVGQFQIELVDKMNYVESILHTLAMLREQGDAVAVYLSEPDCALLSEFKPAELARTAKSLCHVNGAIVPVLTNILTAALV